MSSLCFGCGSDIIHSRIYGTKHSQLKQSMRVICVSHVCNMCGVNHTYVGFLDKTCVYTHAHAVFTHASVFTHVHACMVNNYS